MSDLTAMPATFAAGTTVVYKRSYADYLPSAGWTLTLYIAGPQIILPSVATVSGSEWTITVPASSTATAVAGLYKWEERLTNGTLAYVGDSGVVTLTANIVVASSGEMQSWAERTLAIVEAALAGRLTADMQSYSIAGRSIAKIPVTELIEIRARLKSEVQLSKNPNQFGQSVLGVFTGTAHEAGGYLDTYWRNRG